MKINSFSVDSKSSLIRKIADIAKFIKEYKKISIKNKLINIYLECISQDFYLSI